MNYTKITFILLTISTLLISCKKNHNDDSATFHASFQAVINNSSISFTDASPYRTGWSFNFIKNINGTDSTILLYESSLWKWQFSQDTIIQNSIYIYLINHSPNDSVCDSNSTLQISEHTFRQFFKVGTYTYSFLPWIKGGIVITWYDDKGIAWLTGKIDSWSTFPKTQPDYTRNNLAIFYSNPVAPPYGHFFAQEVHITFNCWVYNESGDSLHIENANYKGVFLQ